MEQVFFLCAVFTWNSKYVDASHFYGRSDVRLAAAGLAWRHSRESLLSLSLTSTQSQQKLF